jgi:membrane-associated protein
MEWLIDLFNLFMHIDEHLKTIIENYGVWTYALLFMIIFCETGLVVTPFLPGDSLLFAAGTFAALGSLNLVWLLVLLMIAAIVGDTVNYWIGHYVGERAFEGHIPLVKKEHLERTQKFYERYGGKTIIIARFVPIIRTFAPFVAGIGSMNYSRFIVYNVVGGMLWVTIFVLGGYFFGNLPVVQENFGLVVVVIIIISVLPMLIEVVKHRLAAKGGVDQQPAGQETPGG